MTTAPGDIRPHATNDDIIKMVESLYGFKVLSMKRLNGYEDLNIHIKVNPTDYDNTNIDKPCESGYIVKVLNTMDTRLNYKHVAGQVELLKVLLDGGIVCPRHVPDKCGQLYIEQDLPDKPRTGTTRHIVRLLEYIEGDILYVTGLTPKLAMQAGELTANMLNLMEGYKDNRLTKDNYLFSHDNLPQLREYLSYVTDEDNKRIAAEFLDKWDSLLDTIATLPRGLIHYDVNDQNLLVGKTADGEKEIVGILDFQDVDDSCQVYDIGNCIMYLMTIADNPLDVGGYCLRGFLRKRKLSQTEMDVLYYCVAARFTVSLVLGLYYYSVNPDPYLLVTQKSWKIFHELWTLPSQDVIKYWLSDKFSEK